MTENSGPNSQTQGFDRNNVENIYPLTPMQTGLLFHSLLHPKAGDYLPQVVLTLRGTLDGARMRAAWQGAVARHAVLRSGFYWERRDQPYQVVYSELSAAWVEQDWHSLSGRQQQARLSHLIECNRAEPFNLQRPPLLRLFWIRLQEDRFHLLWCYHHLVLDGWSAAIVLREVLRDYAGQPAQAGGAPPFADYVAWLNRRDQTRDWDYWRARLADLPPPPALPQASGRLERSAVGRAEAALFEAEFSAVSGFVRKHGITLNTLVQAAYALVLRRYGNNGDIVFGTALAGRPPELPGSLGMVGLFINTVPVRVRIDPDQTLLDWLRSLRADAADNEAHQYLPLRELQQHCNNGLALFDSLLVFESYPSGAEPGDGLLAGTAGVSLESIAFDETTHYPLTLQAAVGATLSLKCRYRSDRFAATDIERLLAHVVTLIRRLSRHPYERVGQIPLLEPEELAPLRAWQATYAPLSETATLADLFEAQVAAGPQRTAAIFADRRLSYAELNRRANRLAHRLIERGVGPDRIVALFLERSLNLMVALLAVQKAGAAWLPLDGANPPSRNQAMLADAGPCLLLFDGTGNTGTAAACQALAGNVPLCDIGETVDAWPDSNPPRRNSPANMAYVIFTSGSTGRPKGVINQQAAIVNRLLWMQRYLRVGDTDLILQKTPLGFDVSVWELFLPFCAGAALVLAKPGGHLDSRYLAELIERERVGILHFVPAMLADFLAEPELAGRCGALREVICSGETLKPELQQRFHRLLPQTRLHNLYGPTEAAVDVTAWECDPTAAGPVPIGRAIDNLRLHVVDADGYEVPVGVAGRLLIGGIGVARGYINHPELTAERFMPDPFAETATVGGQLLYDTGDLARYRGDGALMFLGRADQQIKLRGVRIEPGEVAAALTALPGVRQAVVKFWPDTGTEGLLAAYWVADGETADLDSARFAAALRRQLPEAMIPGVFTRLEQLPLSANGKPDVAGLPRPQQLGTEQLPPQTDQQRLLAQIWRDTLNLSELPGIRDNFFALGGHSLIAIRIVNRIRQQTGIELPLVALFEYPTVEALADRLAPRTDADGSGSAIREITI